MTRKRRDGRCANGKCPKPAHPQDPFCSAECAREKHGTVFPKAATYLGRKPEYIIMHGTTAGYHAGCTCQPCKDAQSQYQRDRRAAAKEAV